MHHPSDKLIQMELLSLILAIVIGTIALMKGILVMIILALFLISCSILSNALLLWHTFHYTDAYKQMARAICLFILIGWMVFYF